MIHINTRHVPKVSEIVPHILGNRKLSKMFFKRFKTAISRMTYLVKAPESSKYVVRSIALMGVLN